MEGSFWHLLLLATSEDWKELASAASFRVAEVDAERVAFALPLWAGVGRGK